jgi:hypothetical protein
MGPLTTDLCAEDSRPYFLWDETTTLREFRHALQEAVPPQRYRLIGKLMREARDLDVWRFVEVSEVREHFAEIRPYLGRRRAFWEYLLDGWKRDGLDP